MYSKTICFSHTENMNACLRGINASNKKIGVDYRVHAAWPTIYQQQKQKKGGVGMLVAEKMD